MSLIANLDINLSAKTDQLFGGLDRAVAKLGTFGKAVLAVKDQVSGGFTSVGSMLAMIATRASAPAMAILALGTAFQKAGEQAEVMKQISRQAEILGISTLRLTGLVSQSGVDAETMTHALQHLNKAAGELALHGGHAAERLGALTAEQKHAANAAGPAAEANSRQAEALQRLGISVGDFLKMNGEERQAAVARGWSRIAHTAEEAAVATSLMGRVGQQLIPILRQGEEGLRRLDENTKEFNLDFDHGKEAVMRSMSAWKQMNLAITGISRQLAIAIAPAWEMLAVAMTSVWKSIGKGIKDNLPLINQFWATVKAIASKVDWSWAPALVSPLYAIGRILLEISRVLGVNMGDWQNWSKSVMDALLMVEFTATKFGAVWDVVIDSVALKLGEWWEDLKAFGAWFKDFFGAISSGDMAALQRTVMGTGARATSDLEKELQAKLRASQKVLEQNFEQFLAAKMAQFQRKTDQIKEQAIGAIKASEGLEAAERGSAAAFRIINQAQGDKMYKALNDILKENKKMAADMQRAAQALANGKPIVVGRV